MGDDKDSFKTSILSILEKFPFGISEYHLMQELKGKSSRIPDPFGQDNLTLFRSHFLLFNALYELQTELAANEEKLLQINPLKIQLTPFTIKSSKKALTDKREANLRSYYLDFGNLENTTAEDVEEMLGKFWEIFYLKDKRLHALKVLGLEREATFDEIKKRYRKLAKELHPDKGGDKKKLQEINEAMEVLRKYRKWSKK